MLLAPFDKERTILKKITEYGALVALGTLLTAHFIPFLQEFESSYTIGMIGITSSNTHVFAEKYSYYDDDDDADDDD